MKNVTYRHLPAFTSRQVCEVANITPRALQLMMQAGAFAPVERGCPGRGHHHRFSVQQAVAVAYGAAFLTAGCHHSWAYEVAEWVARQHPGALLVEFSQDPPHTLLALAPGGQGRMVAPYLPPHATREQHLMLAQLNLQKTYERVLRRALELGVRLAREERELGERLFRRAEVGARKGMSGGDKKTRAAVCS